MPLYEYRCGKCEKRFETLVRSDRQKVGCPHCRSRKVEKIYSIFGLNLGASPSAPAFST